MELSPATWILVPLLGGLIVYVTNRLAVKMIFRPVEPVNVLGLRVQGLIGRRQKDLADSIGRVVGEHLVGHDDIMRGLEHVDLGAMTKKALDRGLAPKIEKLKTSMPMIGMFLTDDRIDDLKSAVVEGLLSNKDAIYEELERAVEEGLDVREIVTQKVAAFEVERLESLVLEVASKELRHIELLGGVLGVLIGVAQVGVIALL